MNSNHGNYLSWVSLSENVCKCNITMLTHLSCVTFWEWLQITLKICNKLHGVHSEKLNELCILYKLSQT